MHLLRKYDVAALRSAMMRCLPQNVAKPRIIRVANIIRRNRHHLPKANIIQKTQRPSPLLYHKIDNKSNDTSPCGDMMHLLRKYDVAPLRSAMMRCLP